MQISNNITVPSYHSTVTNNNDVKNVSSGFDALLNEQKQVPEKKEEGELVTFFEKHHLFDRFSANEKNLFKNILADGTVSIEEIDKLSYEEIKSFANCLNHMPGLSVENLRKMPIINYIGNSRAIFATQMTKNDTFNEAMYRTAREMTSNLERSEILSAVHFNLSQAKNNRELDPFDYEYRPAFNEIENINSEIDFSQFLLDIIEVQKKGMEETKFPNSKKQYQNLLEGYTIIQKHYNDVLNEKKDTYV